MCLYKTTPIFILFVISFLSNERHYPYNKESEEKSLRSSESAMEFQLGIGSQIFKHESDETISYQEHGDYLSRLRCLRFHPGANDGERDKQYNKSFEKA